MAAEAGEEVEDIIAEARSEHEAWDGAGVSGQRSAPEPAPKRARRQSRQPSPATAL